MELPDWLDWIAERKTLLIVALLAMIGVAGVAYAVNALAIYKPSIFTIAVKDLPVVVLSVQISDYDPALDRCTTIIVTLRNNGAEALSNLKVALYLYSNNTLIANGTSPAFTLNPLQQAIIPVSINWIGNETLTACNSGKLVIYV